MNRVNLSILDKIRSLHLGSRSKARFNTIHKRGAMLSEMIAKKDKRKNWYFHILNNTPKSKNVFEEVHRPNKRQRVLDSLFIRNITDVLSTGDVAPEVFGYGIEITGVKVAPCCKIVNVYWQVPPNNYPHDENISRLLNLNAPKIRAEIISRNLMGKVPQIFFVRDSTNAQVAAFEKAMKEIDLGPPNQTSIYPDDSFTTKKKKLYSFKVEKEPSADGVSMKNMSSECDEEKPSKLPPPKPLDMKSDVFGLNHDALMKRVIVSKCQTKVSPHVIDAAEQIDGDLFSKIPGTTLRGDTDRDQLLKQFQLQRKMMKEKNRAVKQYNEHPSLLPSGSENIESPVDDYLPGDDFIEEDTPERF